jgi:hypothetical protein
MKKRANSKKKGGSLTEVIYNNPFSIDDNMTLFEDKFDEFIKKYKIPDTAFVFNSRFISHDKIKENLSESSLITRKKITEGLKNTKKKDGDKTKTNVIISEDRLKNIDIHDDVRILRECINKSYDITNNGIINCDSMLVTEILAQRQQKGGESLPAPLQKRLTFGDNYLLYEQFDTYCENGSCRDLEQYIRENPNTIIGQHEYNKLRDFIDKNKKQQETDIKFGTDLATYHKKYIYHEYNKDIVTAFEHLFINNNNARQLFIKEQMEYHISLSEEKKRIIFDYTNQYSFNFYKMYKANPDNFMTYNKIFDDAFYPQIVRVIGKDRFSDITKFTYDQWLNNIRPSNFRKLTIFDGVLHENEWIIVLNYLIDDLNEIIKYAPPVRDTLHCFRGSSLHYIKNGSTAVATAAGQKLDDKAFISNRLSSYTFNFDTADEFRRNVDGDKSEGIIYRTAISPLSRVLYVAPLSDFPGEYEFISPVDSIFTYNMNDEGTANEFYNNHDAEYCITSQYKFNSIDSILLSTPQPIEFLAAAKVLSETNKDVLEALTKGSSDETDFIYGLIFALKRSNLNIENYFTPDKLRQIGNTLMQSIYIDGYEYKQIYKILGDYYRLLTVSEEYRNKQNKI